MIRALSFAVLAACLVCGAALAQPAPAPPAAVRPLDPAFEAAKAAFEGLPEADRKAIQDGLVWTGDYAGLVDGTFGRRTYDAILAHQRARKLPADGILGSEARTALAAAAKRRRDALGFAVVSDAKAGVAIGVPEKTLPKREANAFGGTRWQSADEKITLDTRAMPGGGAELNALFERLTASQAPGRQVTYRLLRPDSLVVSGETPTGKFYVRYALGSAGIRGFTVGYDKAVADFDRVVVAIANSFVPFPEATAKAPAPVVPPAPPPPAAPAARPTAAATGFVVAPGRVLTIVFAEACREVRVGPAAARLVAADRETGLALFEAGNRPGAPAFPLRAAAEGAAVVALAAQDGGPAAVPGEVGPPARLTAPLQPGASGAPVFDRSGALVGIVARMPASLPQVAGVVPPRAHPLVAAEALAAFLRANGIEPAAAPGEGTRSAGALAAAAAPFVVAVECRP